MKTRPLAMTVGLAVLIGAAAGASHAQHPQAKSSAGPAAPAPAEVARRAQVLASFSGGKITVGELEDVAAQQNPYVRRRYKDPQRLKDLLDNTLRFDLLSAEAERRGYAKNAVVEQAVKQNAVQQLIKSEIDDKLTAASIPSAEIEKYYKDHIDEYVQPALLRASHVLVASEAEASELLAKAKGMDLRAFRQLAQDKSIDQATKLRGGDLGYIDARGHVRGQSDAKVAPAIAKAVFALKTIGDTAPKPVKTEAGYSVVKLTGRRAAVSRTLAEVKDAIRVRLWRDRRQQALDDLVAKLHELVKPELHPALVDAIKLQ